MRTLAEWQTSGQDLRDYLDNPCAIDKELYHTIHVIDIALAWQQARITNREAVVLKNINN